MPKDNIERAIAKGTGADSDADAFEAVVYEGYGPGGVAMLVEALTDNRNRTSSEVRHTFTKNGGSLGEPGSVAWTFEKKGEIVVDASRYWEDDLMPAIDAGAEDVRGRRRLGGGHRPDRLTAVREALEDAGVELDSAELVMRPTTRTPVEEDRVGKLMRLIERSRSTTTCRACTRISTWTPRCSNGWPPPDGSTARARRPSGCVAGTMHFVIPRPYESIVPPSLERWKKEVVVASGIAEIRRRARDPAGRHPPRRPLVAACHARRPATRPNIHMAMPRRAVPEVPAAAQVGAAAVQGIFGRLTWRGTR